MYLKRLSLSGFKTFADNTQLELEPGITAIVGPNGSGKSNIVDAILWALGERSHKALRGHAPTDVIFNGSANRAPLGLAEVSLFFDNEDKTLPLEYKEVQVTRRIFRDGEGEYAINKTNCRLRDVVDLFLDTGVGPESYSIVSQREIDSILSAKPEDRRGLIEGAAGVQKYRARRTETRRKLDRVEADLTRVADIIYELENQIAPLAEQAEIAREYNNYVARLRTLQLAILARDYETRVKRMQGLQEGRVQSGEIVQVAQAEIVRLEAAETELESRLRALEGTMETLQGETTDVVSRLKATEGSIAVARERRRALTEQQEFQAQEIGLLRARITSTQESRATQQAELDAALNASASLSGAAADAEARLGAANARLSEATRELQARQAKVIELMRGSQARREAAATGRAEAAALEHRLHDLERLAKTLDAEAAQVTESGTTARAELDATKQRQAEAAQQATAAREAWQNAQRQQAALADALNAAREKRSALQSRLGALRELEQNLEGVQGGARAVLSAVKRGQLADQYTLVADAIRAPHELENAVEVALGAGVHNLICATDADAKTAINWLKQNQAGRATFLPLPNLRPGGISDKTRALLREKGVRGVASELVKCDKAYAAAVEYLLGRVIVVDTLDVAVALAKRCEFGVRLVTLDGELVLPAGAITGGQGKQKASGLLARKRELDELEANVDALNQELQKQQEALQDSIAAVGQAQEKWRAQQEVENEIRSQIARQEREIEHLEREARRVGNQREATESQIKAARATVATKAAQQAEHDQMAVTLDEQARALDEAVAQAQHIVAERQAEREEIASSVAEVRAQHSATQERLAAMRRAIAELERQLKEFEAQIVSKQASIERAAGEDANIVAGEAELISSLAQLQRRREELETMSAHGRAHRQESLQKLEETGAGLRAQRTALHDAEEELHRIEVRIASTEVEMQDMQRRFAEEFELPFEEALAYRDAIEQKQLALDEIEVLKDKIGGLGNVNIGAVQQHQQVLERLEFLTTQRNDLDASRAQLEEIIADIDSRTRERFMTTFTAIAAAFDTLFQRIFDGGTTHLTLTHPDNLLETGIDLKVQPPGKSVQDISLLSGGERALTALSFMLALLQVHPSPFVVLDEVDAPLDQSNVGRFSQLLREFTDRTQFIVITHNNGTMQAADVLYGVTMQQQGVSTLMSVRLVDTEQGDGGLDGQMNGHANGNGHNGTRNGVARRGLASVG
ncbi:MAG: chromosome segregation protein SMC [Abitibacteriaceae bacterium]|nr:chromosome segregation protein SMC [Abditibacteriaceae bacterium]